jgi:hypothetical protein
MTTEAMTPDDELLNAIRSRLAAGRLAWVDCAEPATADRVFALARSLGCEIETVQSFRHPSNVAIVLTPPQGTTKQ